MDDLEDRNYEVDQYLRLQHLLDRLRRAQPQRPDLGLKPRDFFTMHLIRTMSTPAQPGVQMSRLARKLEISLPALSKAVQALEERGFVRRVADPASRRNTLVELTAQGLALKDEADRAAAAFVRRIFARLGAEQTQQLFQLGDRLVQIAEEEDKNV